MTASYAAELLKMRKRPAIWVLGGLSLALALTFGYLIPYISYATGSASSLEDGMSPQAVLATVLPGGLVTNMLGGFPLFLGALSLIIGGLTAGSEYGWGTVKTTLTQRPRRLQVYGGTISVVLTATAVLTLAVFAVGAIASAVIAGVESAPMRWPDVATLAEGLAAGWLILSMWALLGVLIGFVARGPAMAVGLGLVWSLAIENLVRGVAPLLGPLSGIEKAMPGGNAGSLASALGSTSSGGGATPGVVGAVGGVQATLVLLAFCAAFALIAGWVLQRRDVVA